MSSVTILTTSQLNFLPLNFKLYYRAIAIKTSWYWHKNRHENQWNKIEDPDRNPCSYAQLIFDKGVQNMQWRKDSIFSKCCWENWIAAYTKLKLDACLSPCTSITSKWIKDLNRRPEALKLMQERARSSLELTGIGNDFLGRTQMVQQLRERTAKWDYMKLKSFCKTTRKNVTKLKWLPTEWEKIFAI
jgi:hypothetical protein